MAPEGTSPRGPRAPEGSLSRSPAPAGGATPGAPPPNGTAREAPRTSLTGNPQDAAGRASQPQAEVREHISFLFYSIYM